MQPQKTEKWSKNPTMIPNAEFVRIGHFTSRETWKHPNITVPTWEFIYVTEGEVPLFVGSSRLVAKEGDVVLLPANVEHGGTQQSVKRVSFIWMHIAVKDERADKHLRALACLLRSAESTQIPMMMRQLLHRANYPIYPKEMNDMTAQQIIMEYSLWLEEREKRISDPGLINTVKEWIRINSDRKITVADIADEFSYNADYLTRFFTKKVGISLKNYIDSARMNLLRTKLMTTDAPLKKIASDSGFEDYKAFLKFFTYHEGLSPTKFRESCYMTHKNNK